MLIATSILSIEIWINKTAAKGFLISKIYY